MILWLGANLLLKGEFSVGAYLAFGAWKSQFIGRMDALVNKVVQIGFVWLYAERLADIVFSPTDEHDIASHQPYASDPQAGLQVNQLAYRYATNGEWIFQDINFNIKQGEFVAITGASGCGKTTLLKVLLGLLDAPQGEVTWKGTTLKQWGAGYRIQVAAVMQDDALFAGSLEDNITLFDDKVQSEWMLECARTACIHDEIMGMTMGYQTLVGDMGSTLLGKAETTGTLSKSIVQKTRVVDFERGKSSLDTALEQRINANIKVLNITCVAVAHRPNTLALADRVITLQG